MSHISDVFQPYKIYMGLYFRLKKNCRERERSSVNKLATGIVWCSRVVVHYDRNSFNKSSNCYKAQSFFLIPSSLF